ncbi:hypothetical protein SAMN05444722_3666 [Rhodovulum sp. ES.010]|uniref:hypothetical protein n=1 Tax=Rhodovulum sp. ES.010 TaxID=1882821 RepID=UPI0009282F96|nr:hypothetical protein [Rhodovulum sp. ES.010]SIO56944.1 hypothetical protein SAMN05444722_3666 [Rhodovulum sp. ES.010]
MVGASKILTVSYGTFSCTLEGFDDSFDTMKAIAEYFRDLAADDRYFGAEPPTPDAEMLQRIAEREIRKRVETQIGEDGIVLRPARLPGASSEMRSPPARGAAPPAAEDAPVSGPRSDDETESVAAKLARIRAVVENARAAAPAMPTDAAPPMAWDDTGPEEDAPAPDTEGSPDPKWPDPAAEAPDTPIAEPSAEAATGPTPPVPGHGAPINEAASPPPEAGQPTAADAHGNADDARAGRGAAHAPPTLTAGPTADTVQATPPAPRPRARVLKLKRADLAARAPDPVAPAPETPPAAVPHPPPVAEDGRLPEALEAELQADLAAARAEFEAEWQTTPAPAQPTTDSGRTMPERAENAAPAAAEDAETKAEGADEPRAPEATKPAGETAPQPADDAPTTPRPDPKAVETALQRLWDETNTKLDGAEQQRRRASIAHLKAAVAATFADRKTDGAGRRPDEENARRPYRQVLAKVVRGNRETPRPEERQRLAPLMLVCEQRVDRPRTAPRDTAGAIRPRRVVPDAGAEDEAPRPVGNIFADEPDFSEFVAERGVSGMADTLEAAAAYLLKHEGHDCVSRPQVIRLAMSHLGQDTKREEVLRAFGSLLRVGTFKKVRRGMFVMPGLTTGCGLDGPERRHA